jgi:hypothetical protein
VIFDPTTYPQLSHLRVAQALIDDVVRFTTVAAVSPRHASWWSGRPGGNRMATIWSQLGKEQERRRRERRKQEEWLRKETATAERRGERDLAGASKAAQAEAARQEHADGRAEAGRRNVVIEQELAELADLLQVVLAMPPRSLPWLRADLIFLR